MHVIFNLTMSYLFLFVPHIVPRRKRKCLLYGKYDGGFLSKYQTWVSRSLPFTYCTCVMPAIYGILVSNLISSHRINRVPYVPLSKPGKKRCPFQVRLLSSPYRIPVYDCVSLSVMENIIAICRYKLSRL